MSSSTFLRNNEGKSLFTSSNELLSALLFDNTTKKNIIWATNNYRSKGLGYSYDQPIDINLITGKKSNVIRPRIDKSKAEQAKRIKNAGEVFTPSWMCNKQNNQIDEAWFGHKNVFNIVQENNTWIATDKVVFGKDKSWKDYVYDIRMEITCGEAPYLVSRYDTVTGKEIPIKDRIGLLDRKLRVVAENASNDDEWLEYSIKSVKAVYGYEFQGDSLLIARENVLLTFIDYYNEHMQCEPSEDLLLQIAKIISWNLFQMDGIKLVVPFSCHKEEQMQMSIFDMGIDRPEDMNDVLDSNNCRGCVNGNPRDHNGIRCRVMDWNKNKPIKFVDMLWR